MVHICTPGFSARCGWDGCTAGPWFVDAMWLAAWSNHAARHVERGDTALAAGRTLTAGDSYLRVPDQAGRPPIVLLLPGADSAKEELYNLADHIVARGLAVAAFDGARPGHAELRQQAAARPGGRHPGDCRRTGRPARRGR